MHLFKSTFDINSGLTKNSFKENWLHPLASAGTIIEMKLYFSQKESCCSHISSNTEDGSSNTKVDPVSTCAVHCSLYFTQFQFGQSVNLWCLTGLQKFIIDSNYIASLKNLQGVAQIPHLWSLRINPPLGLHAVSIRWLICFRDMLLVSQEV